MSRALLDINVLLALSDSDHVDHGRVHDWFGAQIASGWATCAITQNGFVRIISQPRYPNPISLGRAVDVLGRAVGGSEHEFWPCEVSLLDQELVDHSRLHSARHVTDAYLLALAVSRGGRFVTFDRGVPVEAVVSAGAEHLSVL